MPTQLEYLYELLCGKLEVQIFSPGSIKDKSLKAKNTIRMHTYNPYLYVDLYICGTDDHSDLETVLSFHHHKLLMANSNSNHDCLDRYCKLSTYRIHPLDITEKEKSKILLAVPEPEELKRIASSPEGDKTLKRIAKKLGIRAQKTRAKPDAWLRALQDTCKNETRLGQLRGSSAPAVPPKAWNQWLRDSGHIVRVIRGHVVNHNLPRAQLKTDASPPPPPPCPPPPSPPDRPPPEKVQIH